MPLASLPEPPVSPCIWKPAMYVAGQLDRTLLAFCRLLEGPAAHARAARQLCRVTPTIELGR